MQNQKLFSAFQFQVYPLELFILFVGFCIGLAIGRLKNNNNDTTCRQKHQEITKIINPSIIQNHAENNILSFSLSTGQSFEKEGIRYKLFKGHLYEYLSTIPTGNSKQHNKSFEVLNSGISKISDDGEWKKCYDSNIRIPKKGKYYYQVYIVKNQYFIKRQGSQKQSNVAVSRTDLIIGFFIVKQTQKINQKLEQICHQSQRQTDNIKNITAYGLNGRIYDNGQLRTEEKVIKKNRVLTIYVNRDDGYIGFQVEGETVGFCIIPKEDANQSKQLIPFVQMYAVGSAVIISS